MWHSWLEVKLTVPGHLKKINKVANLANGLNESPKGALNSDVNQNLIKSVFVLFSQLALLAEGPDSAGPFFF